MACGDASQREGPNGGLGQAVLATEAPTCVTFQRGTSGEVADAKISNRQPNKNFGNDPVASTSQVNRHVEQILLRFDTSGIPAQATLTSATLTLWQVNSGRPTTLMAHAITGPWAEDSVTWSSFGAAYDTSVAASLDASRPAHPSARVLDISGLVGSWVSEPSRNHGLLLAQPEGKTLLATSEHPLEELRPRLEVCYTEAPTGTLPSGTSLFLQVVDSAGNPIPSAAISSQQATFPVDSSGHHLFEDLQPGRFLARVDARGFTSASVSVELSEGAHAGYQVRLLPLGNPSSFQAETGGVIETDSIRVTIPPGAVVDALGRPVSGAVELTVTPLDPTTQLALIPGPLEGATSSGETVQLESFFMAEVSLWRDGAPLQLAPGASAALEFVLPEALASRFQEGDSIPAWWFDLEAGVWRKEGAGTVRPSSAHPGRLSWAVDVQHFTWWNADAPWWDKSCVNVLVVNTAGVPVPNVQVNAAGISYSGVNAPVYTGADGRVCTEIKRGGTARVFAGSPSDPISPTEFVTGSEEPSSCGSDGCASVTLQVQDICTPGAYRECAYSGPEGTLGQGWCQAGRRQCNTLGTRWSDCQGERVPATESCQLPFDEDCDGQTNEACSCSEFEGTPCYGGPAGTEGVGICHAGVVRCDAFGNVTCQGQQLPQRELCSTAEDDNCDGSTECAPTSEWLRILGEGASSKMARELAIDRWGNTVVMGSFQGTVSLGGAPLTADANDLFVAKFNMSGQHVWSQIIQREDAESFLFTDKEDFLAVDGEDNVLLAGSFTGEVRIGDRTLISEGHASIFVAKLSSTGALLWARSFGGFAPSPAWVAGIAADAAGNVLVTGGFQGNLQIGDTEHIAMWRALYVMKLEGNTGEPFWSRSFQGTAEAADLAVDPTGDVLVSGALGHGTLDIDGALITNPESLTNAFVFKLEGSAGSGIWNRLINNDARIGGLEQAQQVVADESGNAWVLTWSNIVPIPSLMKLDSTNGGTLRSTGVAGFSRYLMPDMSLSLDTRGNVVFAGTGITSPGVPGAFLEWYDTDGVYRSRKVFGGTSDGMGSYGVAFGGAASADRTGSVVFAGEFYGSVNFGTGPVLARDGMFLLKLDSTL